MGLAEIFGSANDPDAYQTWRWLLALAVIPGTFVTI